MAWRQYQPLDLRRGPQSPLQKPSQSPLLLPEAKIPVLCPQTPQPHLRRAHQARAQGQRGRPARNLRLQSLFPWLVGKKVSPWHDIPLKLGDGVFNFVVEIPKETSAKTEVATDEPYTPIKQDTKKGKLRYYPYNINWNYRLLLQTWEDPSFANVEVEGAFGDNDPGIFDGSLSLMLITFRLAKQVKPLGALAMIDKGELDWKIIAISLDDPKASLVNDVDDVEKHFLGTLTAIRDWFRDYKIPDGKPANKFCLGNKAANKMALPAEATSVKAGGEVQAPVVAQAGGKAQPKTLKKVRSSKHSRNTETSTISYNDPYQILKYPLTTEAALKNLEENNTLVSVVDK